MASISTYKDSASGSTITGVTKGNSKSGAYTNAGATPSAYKNVYQKYGIIPKSGGGGGGGGGSAEAYSSGGYHTTNDDIISKIKALLNEQKKASDEYANTLYQQALAQNKEAYKSNQWQANKNYMRGDRYLKGLYGDAISGQGLSNKARNNSNWQNNLTSIRQNWTNNDATAKASYNAQLANNASTLAQGWYNYVLPVYTNRQTQLDNLDYWKYLASLSGGYPLFFYDVS